MTYKMIKSLFASILFFCYTQYFSYIINYIHKNSARRYRHLLQRLFNKIKAAATLLITNRVKKALLI